MTHLLCSRASRCIWMLFLRIGLPGGHTRAQMSHITLSSPAGLRRKPGLRSVVFNCILSRESDRWGCFSLGAFGREMCGGCGHKSTTCCKQSFGFSVPLTLNPFLFSCHHHLSSYGQFTPNLPNPQRTER